MLYLLKCIPKLPNVILILLLSSLFGCQDSDQKNIPPKFTSQPQLITPVDSTVPLATIIEFSTDQAVKVTYTISDGNLKWQAQTRLFNPMLLVSTSPESTLLKSTLPIGKNSDNNLQNYKHKHRSVLLKFKPNTLHTINIRITNAFGQETELSKPLIFQTKPLPKHFPIVQASHIIPADNITLFSVGALSTTPPPHSAVSPLPIAWLIAVDNSGDIIWYMPNDKVWHTVEALSSGNLRLYNHAGFALEVDLLGNTVSGWLGEKNYAEQAYFEQKDIKPLRLPVDGLHHRRQVLPNGNTLALTYESVQLDNKSLPDEATQLVSDAVVEMAPTGEIINQWYLFDLLDPKRLTTKSKKRFSYPLYSADNYSADNYSADNYSTEKNLALDWSHANGVAYNADTDTIIVSVNHQKALIGISRSNGSLKWILAEPSEWQAPWQDKILTPTKSNNKIMWPVNSSAPTITKTGDLVIINNDNNRNDIIAYAIDENMMTVTQYWHYPITNNALPRLNYVVANDSFLVSYLNENSTKDSTKDNNILELPRSILANTSPRQTITVNPILSLSVGVNNQWKVFDVIRMEHLIPPDVVNENLTEKPPVLAATLPKIPVSKKTVSKAIPSKAITANTDINEAIVIEGNWVIEVAMATGTERQILKIDKQRGSVAVGYLNTYPVIVAINGNSLSFTARTIGMSGSVKWRYQGAIDKQGIGMVGTFSIRTVNPKHALSDVPWQAHRQ